MKRECVRDRESKRGREGVKEKGNERDGKRECVRERHN